MRKHATIVMYSLLISLVYGTILSAYEDDNITGRERLALAAKSALCVSVSVAGYMSAAQLTTALLQLKEEEIGLDEGVGELIQFYGLPVFSIACCAYGGYSFHKLANDLLGKAVWVNWPAKKRLISQQIEELQQQRDRTPQAQIHLLQEQTEKIKGLVDQREEAYVMIERTRQIEKRMQAMDHKIGKFMWKWLALPFIALFPLMKLDLFKKELKCLAEKVQRRLKFKLV